MTVDGTSLPMWHGDNDELSVGLNGYDLQSRDFLELTVRKAVNGLVFIHKKLTTFSENEAIFSFVPSDTQNLQLLYGSY